jgi:hypothetical protein
MIYNIEFTIVFTKQETKKCALKWIQENPLNFVFVVTFFFNPWCCEVTDIFQFDCISI